MLLLAVLGWQWWHRCQLCRQNGAGLPLLLPRVASPPPFRSEFRRRRLQALVYLTRKHTAIKKGRDFSFFSGSQVFFCFDLCRKHSHTNKKTLKSTIPSQQCHSREHSIEQLSNASLPPDRARAYSGIPNSMQVIQQFIVTNASESISISCCGTNPQEYTARNQISKV